MDRDRDRLEIEASLQEANTAFKQGRVNDAKPIYHRVLVALERVCGSEHPDIAYCLQTLGDIYYGEQDYRNAAEAYSRLLAFGERVLGSDNQDLVPILFRLATTYDRLNQFADADGLYTRAEFLSEKTFPPVHALHAKIR